MNKSEAGKLGAQAARNTLAEAKKHRIAEYYADPKKCRHCSSVLPYENRRNDFCNHSCSQSFNNKGVVRNLRSNKFAKKPCVVCGTETHNVKYCSSKCFQECRWRETVKKIDESGVLLRTTNGVYDYDPRIAKKYLAEKRGRRCEICQCAIWQNQPIPLILDHINGNAEDNRIANVRLVCGNCNMLLPTFAGRNRGNGRESRGKQRNH